MYARLAYSLIDTVTRRDRCFIVDLSSFFLKLNFSEEHYFENILENLKCEAQKSLKKLREPVDPDM